MDSPQSVVSPFKSSLVVEPENQNSSVVVHSSGNPSNGIEAKRNEPAVYNLENFIGTLEVYVHQARDIQNICIYHKQDVYAKFCLTSDPENTISTKIINGGGRNPIFNENLQLSVRALDTSLKCEIYMLSRVRNYLEDQLLGFALVPLSEVLLKSGKLEKDFSLSSTDVFHSPAGFVQLSLSYTGSFPEVMAISVMPETLKNSEAPESIPSELDKIEFPDPNIVNENQIMVSKYFGIPCTSVESETSESLVTSDAENQRRSESGVNFVESFSNAAFTSVEADQKYDSIPSSISTNGASSSPWASATSDSSDAPLASHVSVSAPKGKSTDTESETSSGTSSETIVKPVLTVNVEPEPKVVQQEIVDMYMKSMQQFTESLAKMKLPLDVDSPTRSENSSSDQKLQTPKNNGPRVFYGSRAFF